MHKQVPMGTLGILGLTNDQMVINDVLTVFIGSSCIIDLVVEVL